MSGKRPIRLALDQNFPTPILDLLAKFIVDIELIPLRRIDSRLSTLDDRTLVIALHQLGFPGLVTNNYNPRLAHPQQLFGGRLIPSDQVLLVDGSESAKPLEQAPNRRTMPERE